MSLRLEGFTIRGFGPFDRELTVDLSALAPTDVLVAICGEIGAGKTTALELALPGALWRTTPSRGSLVELATTRDAFLESRVVNGQAWTIRHLVDAVSKKSEALVLDADGQPVLPDSKVTSFDKWAAEHMPAPEVFFASLFAPQGASGFLGAKPTARKEILLHILGPEMQALEQYAEHCRGLARDFKAKLATLDARIADEGARAGDSDALTAELVRLRNVLAGAQAGITASRQALALAEQQAREQAAAREANERRAAAEQSLTGRLDEQRGALVRIEQKIANNQAVLAEAAPIRVAAERLPALRQEIADHAARLATTRAEVTHWQTVVSTESTRETEASQRAGAAEKRQAAAADVKAAAERLPGLRKALETAVAELAREEESLDTVVNKRAAGAEARLDAALRGHRHIAEIDDPGEAPAISRDVLMADAEEVRLAEELPNELAGQMARRNDYRARKVAAEKALRDNELAAARATEIEQARRDEADARAVMTAAAASRQAAGAKLEKAATARDSIDAQLATLQAEIRDVEPLAMKATPLANAEARLAELEPQAAAARAEIARLHAEWESLPALLELPAPPDIAAARGTVEAAEQQARSAERAIGQAETQLEAAVASRNRQLELGERRREAEAELADWTHLAAALGRDGLQAMVIDGAIPEINALTNDLLHSAFGPRFTVEVRTQAADAKGKRLLETLDIWVIDTGDEQHKGREGLAETLSGGEKTIVAEALSLALTQLACRQAGAERPTLIRDESAGALSERYAPRWIEMMRRAAEIIGADRILFVNHNRATWELADARIPIGVLV
jgi:exonuclease SbcC